MSTHTVDLFEAHGKGQQIVRKIFIGNFASMQFTRNPFNVSKKKKKKKIEFILIIKEF